MTDIIQQIWFPITAVLFVVVLMAYAFSRRSRQRRRDAGRPTIVLSDRLRDEDRLN